MTSISVSSDDLESRLKASILDDWAYRKVIQHFGNIQNGLLRVICDGDSHLLGVPSHQVDPVVTLTVHNKALFRHIVFHGMVGAAEMYMAGAWQCSDLLALVKLMCRNMDVLNGIDQKRGFAQKLSGKLWHFLNRNSLSGSARNIAAHYDLSNDFFSLFLDESKMYSAAVFASNETSLAVAAIDKLDLICRKLSLSKDDHLLEIGTGWGGMAIHAARRYGCRVTTTTISEKQYQYTKSQVKQWSLDSQVTVLKQDYRLLSGRFDKLVSIEMIEAVGHRFHDTYFRQCSNLLKPDGLALIQAITIADQRYDAARDEVDFIQRYIFPGGSLPSVSVIAGCVASQTDMQMVDLHDITAHYEKTLRAWRQAFIDNLEAVNALGFDDAFCRMWEYYLCYCEGGFSERVIQASQILLAKPAARLPLQRPGDLSD